MKFPYRLLRAIGLKKLAASLEASRMKVSPLCEAAEGATVRIEGSVAPIGDGLVTGPFSGRTAVVARARIRRMVSAGNTARWEKECEELEQVDFMVDDGSGAHALVDPVGAILGKHLGWRVYEFTAAAEVPPASLEAFARRHGVTPDFDGNIRYEEQLIRPGDTLRVYGPVRALTHKSVGYRDDKSTVVHFAVVPDDGPPMILDDLPVAEALARIDS